MITQATRLQEPQDFTAAKYFAGETNWWAASSSSLTTETSSLVLRLCQVIEVEPAFRS